MRRKNLKKKEFNKCIFLFFCVFTMLKNIFTNNKIKSFFVNVWWALWQLQKKKGKRKKVELKRVDHEHMIIFIFKVTLDLISMDGATFLCITGGQNKLSKPMPAHQQQ